MEVEEDNILPMRPFLVGSSGAPFPPSPLHPRREEDPNPAGTTTLRLGIPGEVGGRAKGAELIECEPRLWVYGDAVLEVGT